MKNTTLSRSRRYSSAELGSTGTRSKQRLVALAAALAIAGTMALPMVARADTETWNGSTADWNTVGNWNAAVPVASDTALFNGTDGSAAAAVTLSAPSPVLGITFDTGAEAYTIGSTANSANVLSVGAGGVTVNALVTQNENLYGPITLTASSTFTNNGTGTLTLGDPSYGTTAPNTNNELVFNAGATLTIAGTGNVTINSTIKSGTVVANLSGAGTLNLNSAVGANAYGIANLTVDGGYVKVTKANQLGYGGALVINAGTYDINSFADSVTASLSGTGGTLTNSSATVAGLGLFTNAPANASYTYGGDITGNIQLSDHGATGSQTLTLSGTNNFGAAGYTAGLSVNNFTLTITGNTTVTSGIAVTPATAGNVGILGGNGTLIQTGTTSNGIVLGRPSSGDGTTAELAPSAGLPTAGDNTLTIITSYGLHFSGGTADAGTPAYSVYVCDIGPAGVSDSVALTGHLYLDTTYSVLNLDSLAGAFGGSTYTIFSFTALTGTFGTVEGLPSNYTLEYNANNIQLVSTTPVPEPASLAVLAIGMAATLVSRRRHVAPGRALRDSR